MEYLHRMLGRTVGLVFLVPCTYFWFRGHFSKRIKRRMLFAGLLIFTQGIIGWWMVKSGLKQKDLNEDSFVPRVSHYRLAVHLSLAFILYGVFLWNGLSCLLTPFDHSNVKSIKRLRGMVHGSKLAIFSTVFIGAFVAGLDAGLVYNSWPTYSGNWIPHELMSGTICGISEFFSNPVSVQFIHRNLAYLTLVVVLLTWIKGRKMLLSNRARLALHSLLVASLLQASLGIGTLVYEVPIPAASAHQNGALILYSIVIWLANEIRKIPK